jgi:hypothetical protein
MFFNGLSSIMDSIKVLKSVNELNKILSTLSNDEKIQFLEEHIV